MIYEIDNELYIKYKEFENYSKSKASAYLKWYLSIKEKRIMYLDDYITKDTNQEGFLDFSEESLIKIWEWFQSKIFVVQRDASEINSMKDMVPDIFKECIEKNHLLKLAQSTVDIIQDISIYYGEFFCVNNPNCHWSFFSTPRSRMSLNTPVIQGFKNKKAALDTRLVINNLAKKSVKESDSLRLYNNYLEWKKVLKA